MDLRAARGLLGVEGGSAAPAKPSERVIAWAVAERGLPHDARRVDHQRLRPSLAAQDMPVFTRRSGNSATIEPRTIAYGRSKTDLELIAVQGAGLRAFQPCSRSR